MLSFNFHKALFLLYFRHLFLFLYFILCPSFKFNVQGSGHRKYPFDIFPTRCNITQFIYFWKTALQVSGGISTHHQEHITTVFTVSGTCQAVTATCSYCGKVGSGLSVVWEMY